MTGKVFTTLFIMILLCSCKGKNDYGSFLNKQLKSHYASYISDYDTIIIIPREGCNACIREAESFLKENGDNKEYLFIFTRTSSQKELTIVFGKDMMEQKNILIDRHHIFHLFEEADSYYPLILTKNTDGNFSYNHLTF
jgi:hypothetical protein